MRIQHNILAMNAYRNYNANTSALSKNLEKLSSGYKINRAGDDAAGLAISEKMRAQITGLNAAQKNVKDGISLVKTAEGAMQEIQDMLNRMDYLATQSANGTYDDPVDRLNLQKEVTALKTEIDRIADSANFNGIKLLDGSLDESIKAKDAVTETVTVNPTESEALTFESGKLAEVGQVLGTNTVLHNEANGSHGTEFGLDLHNFKFNAGKGNSLTVKMGDTEIKLTATEDHGTVTGGVLADAFLGANGYSITVDGKSVDSLDGMLMKGQAMEVKAEGTGLTFTQKNAPTSEATEINGAMNVTISGEIKAKNAEYSFETSSFTGVTPAKGDVLTINGQQYVVKDTDIGANAAASWKNIITNMDKDGLEGYSMAIDGAKVTLKANDAGEKSTPTISYKHAAAATGAGLAGTHKETGAEAVAAKYTSGALTVGNVAADDKLSLTVNYTNDKGEAKSLTVDFTTLAASDNAATATAWKTALAADTEFNSLFNITGDEDGLIFEAKTAGEGKGAVTGVSAVKTGAGGTTVSFGAAPTGATDQVVAKDAVKDVQTYDVTGWNDSNLGPATFGTGASKVEINYDQLSAAGKRGLELSNGYIATLDGNTLTLTAKDGGAVGNTANDHGPDAAPGNIAFNKYDPAIKLTEDARTIKVEQEGATGGAMEGIVTGSYGDFNVSTVNIDTVSATGGERLASTFFDLTEDMVKDGAQITIGQDTFTFTTDEKLIGTGNYVDARKDLTTTAKNLTDIVAASNGGNGNAVWSVGHDGSRITLTETVTHGALDANTSLTDYKNAGTTIFDLSTKEGIEQSLGFVGAGVYTKENVVSEATAGGKPLTLQIGDTSDDFNQMKLSVGDMHVAAMGTEGGTKISDIDISSQEGAKAAVQTIKDAINYVSSVRGDLGATQNRLEHTANNLSVMAENIQDAESTIRDTDIAEEMMAYTKNNILIQSAQAMLAQANAVPQGVLQLLG